MINWDISGNESLAWVDPTSVAAYAKGEIDAGASHSTMGPESREKSDFSRANRLKPWGFLP